MAQKYTMPQAVSPLVDGSGRLNREWVQYLSGLEEVSKRVADNVSELGASPTNSEIATAFNALLTALQSANLQD